MIKFFREYKVKFTNDNSPEYISNKTFCVLNYKLLYKICSHLSGSITFPRHGNFTFCNFHMEYLNLLLCFQCQNLLTTLYNKYFFSCEIVRQYYFYYLYLIFLVSIFFNMNELTRQASECWK